MLATKNTDSLAEPPLDDADGRVDGRAVAGAARQWTATANRRRHALVQRPTECGPRVGGHGSSPVGAGKQRPGSRGELVARRGRGLARRPRRRRPGGNDDTSSLGKARQRVQRLGRHRLDVRHDHSAIAARANRQRLALDARVACQRLIVHEVEAVTRVQDRPDDLAAQPLPHQLEQVHPAHRRMRVPVVHGQVQRDVVAGTALPQHGS